MDAQEQEEVMRRQCWMVWTPNKNPPRSRHDTEAAAETEAERLAQQNPGEPFFVLEAVGLRVVDNMHRVNLRGAPSEFSDDIPF